ncbi:MAG: hypothetical protein ABIP48_33060, partial [Planctomycetota bacterium]
MDFWNYTTLRDACKRSGAIETADDFYQTAFTDAVKMGSGQFCGQLQNERDWEREKKPYYNVWPSIVPMLTRLNLDLDSSLIRLPLPALCIRFPKTKNPLTFEWKGEEVQIRCMLMGTINEGRGLSLLIDVGEVMGDGKDFGVPIYTYRNFRRESGLTVEEALRELGSNELAELGVQIPDALVTDCVRLCCSLCLLEDDPSVIEPDVLSKDRVRFEQTGDEKYVTKAHRRGKVGWNVGRRIEVAPHYRRPHMALVWTGRGRAVPRVVPRRGSVVHREVVEKVPSGFVR